SKVDDERFLHLSKGTSLRSRVSPIFNERLYHDYIRDVLYVVLNQEDVDREYEDLLDIDRTVDLAFSKPARAEPANFGVVELFMGLDKKLDAALWLDTINKNVEDNLKQGLGSEVLVTGRKELTMVRNKLEEKEKRYMLSTYLYMQVLMGVLRYDYFRRYEVHHPKDVVLLCLSISRRLLLTWPYLVANLTSSAESLNGSRGVFNRIVDASLRSVRSMSWMELPSRLEAIRKLQKLSLIDVDIVPPDSMMQLVNYSSLGDLKGGFVDSYLKMATFDTRLRRQLFGQEMHVVHGSYQMAGDMLYLDDSNSVFLPTVASTPPVYYPVGVDDPFNYGTLGVMLARAVSKALGPTGSKVMADGTNVDWWTEATHLHFSRTVDCYMKQYLSMERDSQGFSAKQREELFLSVRSIRIAYDRYQQDEKTRRTNMAELITRDRAFFVRACLLTCSSQEEAERLSRKSRCNLPVMNMPEFARTFGCHKNALLNPEGRCPFM
ncbi:unnamed protein product, partial [Ixodes hexagonus]